MSTPTLEEQRLLARELERRRSRMSVREHLAGIVASTGYAVAAAAVWLMHPPHAVLVVPALMCVLVLALATRVQFDTPFGFTVPTQMAFVPLMFVLPLALVPVAVAVALAIGRLDKVLTGEVAPRALLRSIPNSWFAIGPVAVFAIAGVEPRNAGAVLLIAALLAEFFVDFLAATVQDSITQRASRARPPSRDLDLRRRCRAVRDRARGRPGSTPIPGRGLVSAAAARPVRDVRR